MKLKNWYLIPLIFLIICFPFEHKRYDILLNFSDALYKKFQLASSFNVTIPSYINKAIHFYISDLLIIGGALLLFLKKKLNLKTFFLGQNNMFLSFLFLAALLSILMSDCASYTYLYFSLFNLGMALLAFQITFYGLKDKKELLTVIFWSIIIVGAFESSVAIGQFLTQKNLGLRSFGEHKLNLDKIGHQIAIIPFPEKGRAFFNLFSSIPEGRTVLLRVYGTFSHPNTLAGFLVFTLLLSKACFMTSKKGWQKSAVLFFIALQFLALCLTFSRAGIFAFFISSLIWFTLALSKKWSVYKNKKPTYILLGFIFTLSFACLLSLFPYLKVRGGLVNYNSFVRASDDHRVSCQRTALEAISSRPITGVGFNCFTFFPEKILKTPPQTRDLPHNIYLIIFAEMGILGFASCFLFVFQRLKAIFTQPQSPYFHTLCTIFIAFLLIGFCDAYLWVHQTGRLMFFIVVGFLSATAPDKKNLPLQIDTEVCLS